MPGPDESQEQDLGELADALDHFGEDELDGELELLQEGSMLAEGSGAAAYVEGLEQEEVDDLGRVVAEQSGVIEKPDGITASAVMAAMGGPDDADGDMVPPVLHEVVPKEAQVTAQAVAEAVAASFGMPAPQMAEPAVPAVAEMAQAVPAEDAAASLLEMEWPDDEEMLEEGDNYESVAEVPAITMVPGRETQVHYKPPAPAVRGTASGHGTRIAPMDETEFEEAVEDLEPERVFDDHIKAMRLVGVAVARPVEAAELGVFRRDA